MKENLLGLRIRAKSIIDDVHTFCQKAERVTGEADMTADFIWGNCTLEELVAHLDAIAESACP